MLLFFVFLLQFHPLETPWRVDGIILVQDQLLLLGTVFRALLFPLHIWLFFPFHPVWAPLTPSPLPFPPPHYPCVFVFTLKVESELKGMDSLHVLWTIRILAVTNLQNNFFTGLLVILKNNIHYF